MEQGSYLLAGGELITWKLRGAAGEAYSVFSNVTQPGYPGPPPHRHLRQDESFYVLAGNFQFMVDDRTVPGEPGTFVHVSRGSLHTFANTGNTLGRLLVTVGPAGDFEAFTEEVGEATSESAPPPLSGPPSEEMIAKVVAGAQRHYIEIPAPPAGH